MSRFLAAHSALFSGLACILCGFLLNPAALEAATPARSIPVQMGDHHFSPDRITVQAGETVQLELTNTDGLTPHNFSLQAEATGVNVDTDVGAGKAEVVDITPRTPGTYTFYCNKKLPFMKSHRDRGMQGTLVVTPAAAE